MSEGDTQAWQFGAILPGGFKPAHQIRTKPRDGGVYRLGFKGKGNAGEIIPLDDPRVSITRLLEQPDGNWRSIVFTLDANEDDLPDLDVTLQVKDLHDSLELVHLDDGL